MQKIKEAIIVEGTYDKIKLSQLFDTAIVTTDGFGIYKNIAKVNLIKKLAEKDGIIILTDSDSAGFQIRNYIKNFVKKGIVKHAYIPDIEGKEKRKTKPSKEGFLGVEGINDAIILEAVEKCSVQRCDDAKKITKADLFKDGLSGNEESKKMRMYLTKNLELPKRMSANMLLDVLNSLYTYDEYKEIISKMR
ncbi:MAG: DUF4093 domain-containing protein [Ruminococcaceae bacterium]|nr:DUF4093 domain-containing protein [Oscillospiraceae bacterium]